MKVLKTIGFKEVSIVFMVVVLAGYNYYEMTKKTKPQYKKGNHVNYEHEIQEEQLAQRL